MRGPSTNWHLYKIENLVLWARSVPPVAGLPVKDCKPLWNTGVLEYWSVGKSESQNFKLNWFFHYSITPLLHHSNRLPQGGKTIEATSGGSPKPDSLLVSLGSCLGETETRRRGKKNGLLRYSYCLIREAPVVFTQHGSCLKVKVTPRRRASVSLGS